MPIFTAIAAGATALIAGAGAALGGTIGAFMIMNAGAIAAFAGRTLLTIGISKLIANRSNSKAAGSQDAGARIQLAPSTDNKIPVVYGTAFIEGVVTDAKLSTDNKTMWYVVALAEHTDTTATSGYSFDEVYYENKLVAFDGIDPAKVVSLTTNTAGGPQVDTKVAGRLFIYKFTNGSNSGTNTGGQTAIDILSDSGIPSDIRWNSSLFTNGGQSASMTNTAFVIVKVIYNRDAGTTNLGSVKVKIRNTLSLPGSVIKDYMLNSRYGCGLPISKIDTASLTALDTYSAQNITYIPVGGGSATQQRYAVNGPVNTGIDCLSNLQQLVDTCDSWLQYSELTGQWRVVINRSYTDYTTLGQLFSVDSNNLIGGIEVNPIDLNSTYNEMEVQYPNVNIKDQTDYQVVSLFTTIPSLLSPNEAINKLVIQLPQVNNAVQAKYLGLRRLLQGREDLAISFATDYSGIQIEAGDVIKVTLSQYGWTNKLFRVNYVGEEKYPDGSLGARITAFEYNDNIYADNSIQDFVPSDSTGLIDPNIIGTPAAPIITNSPVNNGDLQSQVITGVVPNTGAVLYMDFNFGTSNNTQTHTLYKSATLGDGRLYSGNTVVQITMSDLPVDTYYWSVTAKNNQVGVTGPAALAPSWDGPSIRPYSSTTKTGASSIGTKIALATVGGILLGQLFKVVSGTGSVPANTTVTDIDPINNEITISNTPTVPLSGATITTSGGGVPFSAMSPNSLGFVKATTYDPRTVGGGSNIVDVTTTATRNIPLIYPGVSVPASEYNTYYSGTWPYTWTSAPSGLGYFDPVQAQSPGGTETDLESLGWYKVVGVDLEGNTLTPSEWGVMTGYLTMTSDVANTQVQLVRYARFDVAPTYYTLQLRSLSDYIIPLTGDYMYNVSLLSGTTGTAPAIILEYGYFIRNVTPGSNVTVVDCTLTLKQNILN